MRKCDFCLINPLNSLEKHYRFSNVKLGIALKAFLSA